VGECLFWYWLTQVVPDKIQTVVKWCVCVCVCVYVEVALQRVEMRMVRWMCGVKLKDRVPSKELRERLGLDDIISVLQQEVAMVWPCVAKRIQ